MWARAGTIIAIIAALAGIVSGFFSFSSNYVSKDVFEAKVEKVEIELAGALQDFREDFKLERQQRQENDLRIYGDQLNFQEEIYQERLRKLDKEPKKDEHEEQYLKRQLDRTRQRNEKIQDVLIEQHRDK